jgi:hypothetical protein
MPRTLGAREIRPWVRERLLRDMAVGDKPDRELAADYNIAEQTVRVHRMNFGHEIAALKRDWAAEFGHIWSTRKENRLSVLTQRLEEIEDQIAALFDHATRETETIRNIDPEASEVPVNGSEYRAYVKEQRALIREIAEETGQLQARAHPIDQSAGGLPQFGTIAQDENGNWFGVK